MFASSRNLFSKYCGLFAGLGMMWENELLSTRWSDRSVTTTLESTKLSRKSLQKIESIRENEKFWILVALNVRDK